MRENRNAACRCVTRFVTIYEMRFRFLIMLAGVLLVTLTGCSLPPVFVEDIRTANSDSGPLLVVLPIGRIDPETGRRIGQDMAWGLREAGYPAVYADKADATDPALHGVVEKTDVGAEVVWLSLRWTLTQPAGDPHSERDDKVVGIYRDQVAIAIDQWIAMSPNAVNLIVADAVPGIHEMAAPLIFPNGIPNGGAVRTANTQGRIVDQQLASIGVPDQQQTTIISGETATQSTSSGDLKLSQFKPAFEPASGDDTLKMTAPEGGTTGATLKLTPPSDSTFTIAPDPSMKIVPTPQFTPDPILKPTKTDSGTNKKAKAKSPLPLPDRRKPNASTKGSTDGVMDPLLPITKTPAAPSVPLSSTNGEGNSDVSPFSTINDDTGPYNDVDALTPESAALVTTDPWLTISKPIALPSSDGNGVTTGTQKAAQTAALAAVNAPPSMSVSSIDSGVNAEQPTETQVVMQPAPAEEIEKIPDPVPVKSAASDSISDTSGELIAQATTDKITAGALNAKAAPNFGRPIFIIRPVIGAPGDGNLALTKALRQALRKINVAVTDTPGNATHILQGSVKIDSPFAARQKVRIVWRVTGIDGTVTGQAVQENQVPQGALDGKWGRTADAIADAAVKGIARLFDQPISATQSGDLAQPDLPHLNNQ